MKIGKTYRFDAAHHLPGYVGKCSNPHGHSYKLEVEVEGGTIPITSSRGEKLSCGGMVMDFAKLDALLAPLLVGILDHHDLDVSTRLLHVERTTAELLVKGIVSWIHKQTLPKGVHLSRVRLYETEKAYAEWTA